MSLFDRFYRVKTGGDVLEKTAAAGDVVAAKVAFWREAKARADGSLLDLAKIAEDVWRDAHNSGVKTASAYDDARPFVASFACAKVVDDAIDAMAKQGSLTNEEAAKLATLNALSAFDDLEKIAFGIGDLMHVVAQNPHVSGMVVGAAVGAAVGALNDEENPLRGAGAGASLGAAVGAMGGQAAHDMHGMRPIGR